MDKLDRLDPDKNPYILVDPIDRFSQREENIPADGRAPMNLRDFELAAQAEEVAKKFLTVENSERQIKPGLSVMLSASGEVFVHRDGFSKRFTEASAEDLREIANFRG